MTRVFQKFLLVFFLGLTLPQFVFAADIFFGSKTSEVRVGEQFEVKIFVNIPEESVNAFEGRVIFPSELVAVKEIRDGNSIINFWINRPEAENNTITFSGITPGGFQGNNGLLFSAVFEARKEGVAKFEINDARVLRNDGTGSEATLTVSPFEVAVSSGAPAEIPVLPKVKDREQPESFMPEIAKDETLFDGKWFVVFATQDKASGIDHYEIKESRQRIVGVFKKWTSAGSPHLLRDQELKSFVFVKAVDKAGNERIIKIAPRNPLVWYENYENWVIIIVMALAVYLGNRMLWGKRRKI